MQPDLFTTPKDSAIAASYEAQNRKVDGWGDTALEFLKSYRLTVKYFLTEDLRVASFGVVQVPAEPRAWGAVIVRACKLGLIEWTGEYRCMDNLKSHSCPKKVWRNKLHHV
jgi:hypothetical protein